MNLVSHSFSVSNQEVQLTQKEFELLRLFSCGFSVRNKELQNVIKLSVEKAKSMVTCSSLAASFASPI